MPLGVKTSLEVTRLDINNNESHGLLNYTLHCYENVYLFEKEKCRGDVVWFYYDTLTLYI